MIRRYKDISGDWWEVEYVEDGVLTVSTFKGPNAEELAREFFGIVGSGLVIPNPEDPLTY